MVANDLPAEGSPADREAAAPGQAVRLLDMSEAVHLASLFKILSDPTRVRIIAALAQAELCVNDLAAALAMEQSAVSHQLRILRDWQLVRWRRAGRQVYYTLNDSHVSDAVNRSLARLQGGAQ